MKIYKVLHIPTGMYYKPSKYPSHSNLSKTGKVYHTKPNIESFLSYAGRMTYNHPLKSKNWNSPSYESRSTKLEDWKIIEGEIG